MQELRANTEVIVRIGSFMDKDDGITPETGITLGVADEAVLLKHNGAAVVDLTESGIIWEAIAGDDGWYNLTLSASHTDTEGLLDVNVQDASICLPVTKSFMVLSEAAYDSKYVAKDSGFMDVNVKAVGGTEQSATDLKDFVDTGYDPVTHSIEQCKVNDDMVGTDGANTTVPDAAGTAATLHDATDELIGNLATGTAAISTGCKTAPDGFVINTGANEGGNEDNTHEANNTFHTIEDVGNALDVYYIFDVGGNGVPVTVTWKGYVQGNNDDVAIKAYNWVTSGWEQIGSIRGSTGETIQTLTWDFLSSHVGTGANLGLVHVAFISADMNKLGTDRIFVSYAIVTQSVGYSKGAIWVDTVNGSNENTEVYVDGVADNPVSTWAAALTLSAALGIKRFEIASGSSIELTGNSDNYELLGREWTLALGGQSITGAYIHGAVVTGIGTGVGARFFYCKIAQGGTITLAACGMMSCAMCGSIVLSSAGSYFFDGCFSGTAGAIMSDIDFAAAGDTFLNMRHYSGSIEIKNMNANGTDAMTLEGVGQLIINGDSGSSCFGGTIAIRGCFTVTDNTGGVVTLLDDARYDQTQVLNAVTDDATRIHASQLNTHTAITPAQAGDNMNLADDAIKATKYDESTAFPVKSDDSGVTQIARVGAHGDTLEKLSDEIAAVQSDVTTIAADVENIDGDAMRGTDGANTTVPDVAGTAAGLHSTTDGKIDGLNDPAASDIVTAMLAATGITAGGTWTLAKLLKITTAWAVGQWQDKSGESGTYEVLDGEDGTTVIVEVTPSDTSPQKQTTIL